MNDLQKMEEEKSVLRWGGLAGILGGIIFILVFVIVIAFVGPDPAEPEGEVMRFPDIRAARTVENSLYLLVLILWVTLFLALYRALRGTSLAPALFGSVLSIVGLVVLAAGALPHVAQAPISELYHAPGATPEDQATLVLLWQATQRIFDALFVVGLLLVPIGIIALGVAMLGAPAFGKGFGGVSVVLGVVGLVAASALLVDPQSPMAFVGVLALIIFHLVVGWKVYSLSRVPWET
jgi:magnesium-transporting ATPase (P-type)